LKNENSEYVVLKLSTGEQVMALKIAETEEVTTVLYPMLINMLMQKASEDTVTSRFTAMPLCQFSDHAEYELKNKFIVYELPLSNDMITHFRKLVVRSAEEGDASLGDWEDESYEEDEEEYVAVSEEVRKKYH